MTTLQETISDHRPNPLGQAVQEASTRPDGTRNISQVADELGLMACPKENLPPALRKAREALEQSARLKEEAEGEVRQGMADWQHYESALVEVQKLREDVAAVENKLALCQKDTEGLQADCDLGVLNIRTQQFGLIVNRVQTALAARELIKLLPVSLKAMRAKLHKAEAEIAAMEKQHGFKPAAPARPASQWPQPEAEPQYEQPAAFRGQQ
jgi:chemotaxis regulatin CheY-phosphate phosphatase CheZ